MRLLLLDGCGAAATLALADSAQSPAVFAGSALAERSAASSLLPALRRLLAESQLELSSFDALAVVSGPGSFTGVRIAVSAAKGLSEGSGLPLIALSRLAVLASLSTAARIQGQRIHALLDAGRGEFYCGTYALHDGRLLCEGESLLTRAELSQLLAATPGRLCLCEQRVADAVKDLSPEQIPEPVAADAYSLALAAYQAGEFADATLLDANYLRRADAEMLAKQQAAHLPGRIRRAAEQDAEELAELGELAPEAAQWSAAEYARMLQQDETEKLRRWIYVLAEGEQLNGLVVAKLLDTQAEIENLVVRPALRRRGVARALCAAALQAVGKAGALEVELEVRESNHAARQLYAELGFTASGRRGDYYAHPREDALLLRLSLPQSVRGSARHIMEAHG